MLLNRTPFDSTQHANRSTRRVLHRKENKMVAVEKDKPKNNPLEYCTRNLLENNICVKLRKPVIQKIPKSAISRKEESRESKDFHSANCLVQTPDSDTELKEKHHKPAKRHKSADVSQANSVESHERVISWAADAEAYLPKIHMSRSKREGSSGLELQDRYTEESFPKLDALGFKWIASSSVKMMKLNGVFQPVNKYERPRNNHNSCEIPLSKPILEYETLMLPVKEKPLQKQSDWCETADSKLKGDMRVSWSSNIRPKEDSSGKCLTTSQSRRSHISSATLFSDKAVSLCSSFKKPEYNQGKSNVETVGVKWAFPRGQPRQLVHSAPHSRCSTKDLHPVTTAMDREGTSLERTRGKVITSSCSYNSHAYWMETLKSIKSPSYGMDSNLRGFMVDTNVSHDICVPGFDSMYVMVGETTPSL